MFDFAQGLLVIVITALTFLLIIIGIQVANILKEFKRSLEKVNKILDDAGMISESVAKPVSEFSGFFKTIGLLVDFVKDRRKKGEEKEEREEESPTSPRPEKPRRRFFVKEGKKLA